MIEKRIKLPTLAMIAGTRFGLGFGLGLLLADRLNASERRAAGWALAIFGAITTIPLIADVLFDDPSKNGDSTRRRESKTDEFDYGSRAMMAR